MLNHNRTLNRPSPEEDYYAWAMNTAQRARAGLLTPQELEQVAEELEGMAKSERRALKNRLAVLLAHLLKWHYQPQERSYSWEGTIGEQRIELKALLEENPSLKPELPLFIGQAYKIGIKKAVKETNRDESTFPATFEDTGWTLEQILDEDYFPD